MHSSIYLKHYRLPLEAIGSFGDKTPQGTFKATDSRSGAPVSLTLLPVANIPEEQRESFEQRARALNQFDHLHVARLVDFGREDDVYAFVSESPNGETAAEWVAQYGRMPPEAVLRVGLQVVSAIGAAAFQKLFHRAINPSNIVIVPGQMAEGGWPAIKLINLVSDGFVPGREAAAGDVQFAGPETLRDGTVDFRSEVYSLGATMAYLLTGAYYSAEPKSLQTRRFARPLRRLLRPMLRQNPEERPQDPVMITDALRSCLEKVERRQLLARRFGIPFFAIRTREAPKPRLRSSKIPRPVMAHLGESGVASAEPPPPVLEPVEPEPVGFRTWAGRAAIVVAILLGLGLFAAALMPGAALALLEGKHAVKEVGVTQPAPVWEGKPLVLDKNRIPVAGNRSAAAASSPARAANSPAPAAAIVRVSPSPEKTTASESGAFAANNVTAPVPAASATESAQTQPSPPAEGPESVWEKAGDRPLNKRIASRDAVSEKPSDTSEPGEDKAAHEKAQSESKHSLGASRSKRVAENSDESAHVRREKTDQSAADEGQMPDEDERADENSRSEAKRSSDAGRSKQLASNSDENFRGRAKSAISNRLPSRGGTVRATAHMGTDGSVILRLPDGTIAVIPPSRVEYRPRRVHSRRRVYIDPETGYPTYAPPGYYSPRD